MASTNVNASQLRQRPEPDIESAGKLQFILNTDKGTLTMLIRVLAAVAGGVLLAGAAGAAELNLYTGRHYQTDEQLYAGFTKKTGITINRIEGKEDDIIERVKREGASSPADVLITVDAGRIWRADEAGLFAPVKSKLLEERIPAEFRQPDGRWFGFSTRARVIYYDKAKVKPGVDIKTYEDLADPKWKGQVCIRSGTNMYNLSLMSALIHHLGEAKAEAWAKGVVANMARPPQGGDTDQIKAVAAGECALGVGNTYYLVRLMRSDKPADKAIAAKVGAFFPNQDGRGAHVNVAGGGMVKTAPNKESAVKFLEYLASDEAQRYFADGNNEYAVVKSVKLDNPALQALGAFKADPINIEHLGKNQPAAQKLFERVDWK
jgi:iron(III) transport system substrate-binding protein